MQAGTLCSRSGKYFLPDGEDAKKTAFFTSKYIKKANAVALPPDPYRFSLSDAHCCRSCKKIIIAYDGANGIYD